MNLGEQLLAVFVFGFAGSFHCAAMCGPLAGAACQKVVGWQALQYQLARLAGYASLGAIAGMVGLLGRELFLIQLEHTGQLAGLIFGCISLFYALNELRHALFALRQGNERSSEASAQKNFTPNRIQRLLLKSGLPRPVTFGLLTALLPCGFLSAGILQATTFAHPAQSALAMCFFAFGTAPALWGGAGLVTFLRNLFPRYHRLTLALLLVCVSIFVLWRGWPVPNNEPGAENSHHHHHH